MNVEIGAEAALFPEKEYIKGIFVAVLKKKPSCEKTGRKPVLQIRDPVPFLPLDPGSGMGKNAG
jgi:hypothetical protein